MYALLLFSVHGVGLLVHGVEIFLRVSEINVSSCMADVAAAVSHHHQYDQKMQAASSSSDLPPPGEKGLSGASESTFRALNVVLQCFFHAQGVLLSKEKPRSSLLNRQDGALALRLFYQARRHDLQVRTISATCSAFAAIRFDGRVVTWGHRKCGGNSSQVQKFMVTGTVQSISATRGAFAAMKSNGSVVTWGSPEVGGDGKMPKKNFGFLVREGLRLR